MFIFLDRDGTIIKDKGYIHKVGDLEFLPGAIEGLKKIRDAGCKFVIVTNQAGLARKMFDTRQLNIFHKELIRRLNANGITIDKIYHCPHHPDFTGPCLCRKPNTGMVRLAAKKFKLSPADCVYVGDKDSDIELGKNCGGVTVLIENGQYANNSQPDFRAKNLEHAFEILKLANVI